MAKKANKYKADGSLQTQAKRRFGVGNLIFFGVTGAIILYGGYTWLFHHGPKTDVAVVELPASFSPEASMGGKIFAENCASCHGVNAAGGTGNGPPLVHKIYEPSHHGDGAFYNAVANGVQAHHWGFGNMPAQEVSQSDVSLIVAYVRELQRANGID